MFHDTARTPSGSTAKVKFDQRTADALSRRPIAGPGIKIDQTARGVRIRALPLRRNVTQTLFPFKVFNPTGDPEIFRIHGGYIEYPNYYPTSLTARDISINSAHKIRQVTCTDQVYFDNSAAAQSAANDLTLDTWTSSPSIPNTACAIFLDVTQAAATPDAPTFAITPVYYNTANVTEQPVAALLDLAQGGSQFTRILLAMIEPVLAASVTPGDFDLVGSKFAQFVRSQIVVNRDSTRGQAPLIGYEAERVYFPGEMIYTGDVYLHRGTSACIGKDPTAGAPWKKLT